MSISRPNISVKGYRKASSLGGRGEQILPPLAGGGQGEGAFFTFHSHPDLLPSREREPMGLGFGYSEF